MMKRTSAVTRASKKARTAPSPPPPQPEVPTPKTWQEFDAATGGLVVRSYKAMMEARANMQAACAKEAESPDSQDLPEVVDEYHSAVVNLKAALIAAPPVRVYRLIADKTEWFFSRDEAEYSTGFWRDLSKVTSTGSIRCEEEDIETLTVAQLMLLFHKIN